MYKYKIPKPSKNDIEEMSTSGGAGGYLTKYAFKIPQSKKQLTKTIPTVKEFQQNRLNSFEILENRLKEILNLLEQGKHDTVTYYESNPDSYEVLKGTDLISEYLNDIETLLK